VSKNPKAGSKAEKKLRTIKREAEVKKYDDYLNSPEFVDAVQSGSQVQITILGLREMKAEVSADLAETLEQPNRAAEEPRPSRWAFDWNALKPLVREIMDEHPEIIEPFKRGKYILLRQYLRVADPKLRQLDGTGALQPHLRELRKEIFKT
jgi:hypothetical protein